ncbi:phage tail termination protein [Enterobacter cloacae]
MRRHQELSDTSIVFRLSGNTEICNDLGSNDYMLVDVFSAKDKCRAASEKAPGIINSV